MHDYKSVQWLQIVTAKLTPYIHTHRHASPIWPTDLQSSASWAKNVVLCCVSSIQPSLLWSLATSWTIFLHCEVANGPSLLLTITVLSMSWCCCSAKLFVVFLVLFFPACPFRQFLSPEYKPYYVTERACSCSLINSFYRMHVERCLSICVIYKMCMHSFQTSDLNLTLIPTPSVKLPRNLILSLGKSHSAFCKLHRPTN